MDDDQNLLNRYAYNGEEDAFRELVRRRFGLVWSVALRQLGGDQELARDVSQLVFTELAQKAKSLGKYHLLSGWLYTTSRYTAIDLARTEARRREQSASDMYEPSNAKADDQ